MGRLWVRKKEEKKKIAQTLVTRSSLYGLRNCRGGGDVLWHTSRMKSPVLSPARSALLPGSTLSRYCRAGNSAEGRKSSSAVAWVWAGKQIQKYKSCNFNPYNSALILTHFLSSERDICSKFLSSILHIFESHGLLAHSIFGEWSEPKTLACKDDFKKKTKTSTS